MHDSLSYRFCSDFFNTHFVLKIKCAVAEWNGVGHMGLNAIRVMLKNDESRTMPGTVNFRNL